MTFFVEQVNKRKDEVIRVGKAETLTDAIAIAKGIVDENLRHQFRYEATADALYTRYQDSGIVPCIFRDDGETLNVRNFDHYQYASLQCVKLCMAPGRAPANTTTAGDNGIEGN